jgi:hypothetical protein
VSKATISSVKAETDNRIDANHRTACDPKHVVASGAQSGTKQPRRRHIDPTTCERDYTIQEREFMVALDAYKRASGRMFPTCSEILEVIRNLGYVQCDLPTNSTEIVRGETGVQMSPALTR